MIKRFHAKVPWKVPCGLKYKIKWTGITARHSVNALGLADFISKIIPAFTYCAEIVNIS
jgi:hypothetical protein